MYERNIMEEVRELRPDEQKEVLDFAAFLRQRSAARQRRSIRGALEHLNVDLTQADFEEARRETWRHFPRDIFK